VTIDVSDLDRGIAFWGGLLDLVETRRYQEYAWLGEVAPGVELILQQTADRKLNKNRVHFDIAGDPPAALEGRARELGAIVVDEVDNPAYALVVMADPDGNEFCISRRPSSTTVAGSTGNERR
jgi:catechol 2,3-dioxygenase-like lactoylglutathione lyase family enzyme